jgi:hypothetical protein
VPTSNSVPITNLIYDEEGKKKNNVATIYTHSPSSRGFTFIVTDRSGE